MRGLTRFLLGSILGAALGVLIAERRKKSGSPALRKPLFEGTCVPVGADTVAPVAPSDHAPVSAAVAPQPVVPAPESVAPPVPVFTPEPAAVPQPAAVVEAPVVVEMPPFAAEPVVEPEPVSDTESVEEPVVGPEPVEAPEPVVASEPVAEAEPASEPEKESPNSVEFESLAVAFAAFDLKPTVESEPAVDDQPLAEADVFTETEPSTEPDTPEVDTAAVEPVIGDAAATEPELVDLGSFDVVVSPDLLDEPIPGSGWQSSLEPLAEEDFEQAFLIPMEKEVAEPLPAASVESEQVEIVERAPSNGAGAAAAVPGISPDDLRARIEETRRRIRRELDEPFLSESETTPSPVAPESLLEPRQGAPAQESEGEEEIADLVVDSRIEPEQEPVTLETTTSAVPAPPKPAEVPAGTDQEVAAEYYAIKARIQETRSRLKAKAFDAMMTGESALLGRDGSERLVGQPGMPNLDVEIDQTIERGLREEDN